MISKWSIWRKPEILATYECLAEIVEVSEVYDRDVRLSVNNYRDWAEQVNHVKLTVKINCDPKLFSIEPTYRTAPHFEDGIIINFYDLTEYHKFLIML